MWPSRRQWLEWQTQIQEESEFEEASQEGTSSEDSQRVEGCSPDPRLRKSFTRLENTANFRGFSRGAKIRDV